MIGIIDYHGGNAPSVQNALKKIDFPGILINTPKQIEEADFIILPGVGSAAATLNSLDTLGLTKPLLSHIKDKKRPFLGICIGYQILFERSQEGDTKCWGIVKGTVKKYDTQAVRVPQIGWNTVTSPAGHPFFEGLHTPHYCYFVNSYYGTPENTKLIVGRTTYAKEFSSMLHSENVVAAQFHLEKSGQTGLSILKNILTYFK